MTTGLENFPPIARSMGLKVAAGAWISTNGTQNNLEIANLIAAANAGNVDIAIVGSEALLRGLRDGKVTPPRGWRLRGA